MHVPGKSCCSFWKHLHTPTQTLSPQAFITYFRILKKSEPCFPAAAHSGKLNVWRITLCKGLNTPVMHQTGAYSVFLVESWQDFALIPLMGIWHAVDLKHSLLNASGFFIELILNQNGVHAEVNVFQRSTFLASSCANLRARWLKRA